MVQTVLFPSGYFGVDKVDEDLQREYDAVVNTGLFDIILFGYEKWFYGRKLMWNKVPDEVVTVVYRGWMMQPEQYESFYQSLLENKILLITTPEEYRRFHVFPNIYPLLEEDTAGMIIFPENIPVDLDTVRHSFKRFMVKDYVKSVKGTDFSVYFENTVSKKEFDKWMEVFYKYRGDLFTGRICMKEFLDLKQYNRKTNEYRVCYINHEVAAISRNSGQMALAEAPPGELIENYSQLPRLKIICWDEVNKMICKILQPDTREDQEEAGHHNIAISGVLCYTKRYYLIMDAHWSLLAFSFRLDL